MTTTSPGPQAAALVPDRHVGGAVEDPEDLLTVVQVDRPALAGAQPPGGQHDPPQTGPASGDGREAGVRHGEAGEVGHPANVAVGSASTCSTVRTAWAVIGGLVCA